MCLALTPGLVLMWHIQPQSLTELYVRLGLIFTRIVPSVTQDKPFFTITLNFHVEWPQSMFITRIETE